MKRVPWADLKPQVAELLDAAEAASRRAYAPYSNFRVGAALRTTRRPKVLYKAGNVENVSYGLTCCAERAAVFKAVAAVGRAMRIQQIAVFADTDTIAPCGACRQVLYEFGRDAIVYYRVDGQVAEATVAELLPDSFKLGPSTPPL